MTEEQAQEVMNRAQAVQEAVLEEAHEEGFENMTIGGAYRLAYVAIAKDRGYQ